MDVKEMLFMRGGEGEGSYFQSTSTYTKSPIHVSKPLLENAVQSLLKENSLPFQVMNIADLGCATSLYTFSMIEMVIENVRKACSESKCMQLPEFQFWLNDLPGNDFNTLFKALSRFLDVGGEKCKDVSCFVMGAPGSFYGRLFPRNTLHLVHSSYSVCFLSKVPRLRDEAGLPLNKGKIYISKTSPPAVREAYLSQYQQDLSLFLKSRFQEMIPNGRLVLILPGMPSADLACKEAVYVWELLAEAIACLVSLQLVDEDKLDTFDVPYYMPTIEEFKQVVDSEGSFETELMETYQSAESGLDTFATDLADEKLRDVAKYLTNSGLRCFTQSLVSHHFGMEISDKVYDKVNDLLVRDLIAKSVPVNIVSIRVVLKRIAK